MILIFILLFIKFEIFNKNIYWTYKLKYDKILTYINMYNVHINICLLYIVHMYNIIYSIKHLYFFHVFWVILLQFYWSRNSSYSHWRWNFLVFVFNEVYKLYNDYIYIYNRTNLVILVTLYPRSYWSIHL